MNVHHRIGLRDSATFSCPFCIGGTVTAGINPEGDGVVLHTVPHCSRYDMADDVSFLKDAKEKMRATAKGAHCKVCDESAMAAASLIHKPDCSVFRDLVKRGDSPIAEFHRNRLKAQS